VFEFNELEYYSPTPLPVFPDPAAIAHVLTIAAPCSPHHLRHVHHLQVFEFNELEYYSPIPGSTTGEHRFNFWGYSTVNFFSPMARYSFAIASGADGAALQQEFKLLVREAHKRGIEVSLAR
jgi:pullulanase/glycogen debranching enzyme